MTPKRINFEAEENALEQAFKETFEKAFIYLKTLSEIISIKRLSDLTGINRSTLSTALNGTPYGNEKPTTLPRKHWQTIIDIVYAMQLESVIKMTEEKGSHEPYKFSQLWEKSHK